MFLLDFLGKQYNGRTVYENFEMLISSLIVLLVSCIIVYGIILVCIRSVEDFSVGLSYIDGSIFKDTFGMILTVLILLEFNHSIVSALRQRTGSIQVSIIVLITITVISRKLILLDYASASLETLLGLGGLALLLGALYWLIAAVEKEKQSIAPETR
jgi:uncharacterized membrane protein (DUF373 family)